MEMFGIIGKVMFIPIVFIISMILALTLRKREIEKIVFVEIDEKLKDLHPREFFYNILKIEKGAKLIYWTEIFMLILDTVYILFGGYFQYLKKVEFEIKYPDFPISPAISLFIEFSIPIGVCLFYAKKRK